MSKASALQARGKRVVFDTDGTPAETTQPQQQQSQQQQHTSVQQVTSPSLTSHSTKSNKRKTFDLSDSSLSSVIPLRPPDPNTNNTENQKRKKHTHLSPESSSAPSPATSSTPSPVQAQVPAASRVPWRSNLSEIRGSGGGSGHGGHNGGRRGGWSQSGSSHVASNDAVNGKSKAKTIPASAPVLTSPSTAPITSPSLQSSSPSTPVSSTPSATTPSTPSEPVCILLFYQYVRPGWSSLERTAASTYIRDAATRYGITGRVRVAFEGVNSTLSGTVTGVDQFCQSLRDYECSDEKGGTRYVFAQTDFKRTGSNEGITTKHLLKGLKVWHVDELVTYGLSPTEASITHGGVHLPPTEWHKRATDPNTVIIDVRNANESAIGRFQPPENATATTTTTTTTTITTSAPTESPVTDSTSSTSRVLDPGMKVSTEFPGWVDKHMSDLKGKQILMYCTGGIRCERASALLVEKGLKNVYQLEGGIHKYLEEFPEGQHKTPQLHAPHTASTLHYPAPIQQDSQLTV